MVLVRNIDTAASISSSIGALSPEFSLTILSQNFDIIIFYPDVLYVYVLIAQKDI